MDNGFIVKENATFMENDCEHRALRLSLLAEKLRVARRWDGRGSPSETEPPPRHPPEAPLHEPSELVPAVLTAESQALRQQGLGRVCGGRETPEPGAVSEQADAPPQRDSVCLWKEEGSGRGG